MASFLRRLQGPHSQSRGSLAPSSTTPASPTAFGTDTHLFLVEVIAFGEVYAVPVTKSTPATVVLRYVMEAAVAPEDAAQMGSTEATLYFKEKPLPLDTVMGLLPKRAVLHLHTSLTATASIVRDHRQSAVSMLPQGRQRFSQTTVTMQPVLKEDREGSGSTAAGISSEGSPTVERGGSPAEPHSIFPHSSVSFDAATAATTPPHVPMMYSPVMMPMFPATPQMMPYCYCMPGGYAGSPMMRMVGLQSRTVSAPSLSASRRRDSAVEYANSFHFPLSENPLGSSSAVSTPRVAPIGSGFAAAAASRGSVTKSEVTSPRANAPVEDRLHVVVYLRLPRERAAARLSAAALSADCTVDMSVVEPDEVPLDELLNTTFSTVATNKSQLSRDYSYRRLRVRRDFPVGTLRELCAVDARHRLHLAHAEIKDERQSFADLHVPANAVFYFKAVNGRGGSGSGGGSPAKARALTRERLQEHIEAGSQRSDAGSPSQINVTSPSLDRSLPSPSRAEQPPPHRVRATADCGPVSVKRHNSSSSVSSQSIHERIEAFNGEAVHNPVRGDDDDSNGAMCGAADEGGRPGAAFPTRYVVEGRELTVTSAVASEQARRAAALAARKAEAEAEAAGGAVARVEWEEDVDVDVTADSQPDAPPPTLSTARGTAASPSQTATKEEETARHRSPDPLPHPLSATDAEASALGERRSAFRLLRRASAAAAAALQPLSSSAATSRTSSIASTSSSQRGPHPGRWSRNAKARRQRKAKHATATTTAAATAAADAPCAPLVAADVAADITTATTKKAKKHSKTAVTVRSGTPVPLSAELHSHAVSSPASATSSRSSSLSTSLKARLRKLTRRSSKDAAVAQTSSPPSSPPAAAAVPASATDEALESLRRKSERASRTRAAVAVASAAHSVEAAPQTTAEKTVKPPTPTTTTTTVTAVTESAVETPAPEKSRRSSTAASSVSYSERRRQSTDAVARQPIAFLGSSPGKQRHPHPLQPATAAVAGHTSSTLEEESETLGPNALSNTRMPTPRLPTPRGSPSPVSILVSPSSLEQRRRESSSAEATRMTEANVQHCRRASPEARTVTPDYSVESTGSFNRLRITIRDPEDPTRFHYGVPVEPECPVGELREWITAMQHPASVTGKPAPSLRDVDRYGVFVGDTLLADEMRVTFGAVTGGRNDVVFSIRRRS